MEYTYEQTITSAHLRLLRPVQITHTDLRFDIITVPRESAPSYTAVSYTWGTDPPTETIRLNGRIFHIRVNLWSCLHYIGQAARHEPWSYLWVDAICINQASTEERNQQVKCMDKTYANAATVSVWLGLAPIPEYRVPDWTRYTPVKTLSMDSFSWHDHIDDLTNRPYWSRYWVIQEFLLAGRLMIYCSDTCMDWSDLKDMVEIEQEAGYGTIHSSASRQFAALPLLQGRHPDKHPEVLQPLSTLLKEHHQSQCKDPRDRIFSLLGLIPQHDRDFLGRVFPDYSLSEDAVRIITLAHIMQFDSLDDPELEKVTPESDGIFLGLGVKDKAERKRLLKLTAEMDIDYIGGLDHGGLVDSELADISRHIRSSSDESSWEPYSNWEVNAEPFFGNDMQENMIEHQARLDGMNALLPLPYLEGYDESNQGGGGRWIRWAVVTSIVVIGWYYWRSKMV